MGVKQHFMALVGIGHQPEGAGGAQLHVGELDLAEDAADDESFLAPVELEGFAQAEGQRDVGRAGGHCASLTTPGPDEGGDTAVAAGKALGLELGE